jgi:acylphosphatase
MKALHVRVEGRVQGVWFRATTQEQAQRLRVSGWVRNTAQGDVEIFMQGQDQEVDQLLEWCHHGPPGARVMDLHAEPAQIDAELRGFIIRH